MSKAAETSDRLAERVEALARELLPAGRKFGNTWRAGSVAGDKGESLSVILTGPQRGHWSDFASGEHGDLLDLISTVHRLPLNEAMRWAAGRLGLDTSRPAPRPRPAPAPTPEASDDGAQKLARIRALFERSRPIRGTPAEIYLAARGLALPDDGSLFDPAALRFVADCWHWPSQSRLPAMLAPIVDIHTNELQGLHQTFLKADGSGKADVDRPRLYYGRKAGGCIKLTNDADVTLGLAIGEGLETCLTGRFAGYPTWALMDAGNLGAFPALNGIESLTILADNDDAGRKAAEATAARWHAAGREVAVWRAPADARKGHDLNDELGGVRYA